MPENPGIPSPLPGTTGPLHDEPEDDEVTPNLLARSAVRLIGMAEVLSNGGVAAAVGVADGAIRLLELAVEWKRSIVSEYLERDPMRDAGLE